MLPTFQWQSRWWSTSKFALWCLDPLENCLWSWYPHIDCGSQNYCGAIHYIRIGGLTSIFQSLFRADGLDTHPMAEHSASALGLFWQIFLKSIFKLVWQATRKIREAYFLMDDWNRILRSTLVLDTAIKVIKYTAAQFGMDWTFN